MAKRKTLRDVYQEGRKAFLDGALDQCPYKGTDNAKHWWIGWLDARSELWERSGRRDNWYPLIPLPDYLLGQ